MRLLHKMIFPSGNIHPSYIRYVGWSFASNVLVSTQTAISTHSMLCAVTSGVETLRTANYIGKDIIGQLGGLGFMAKLGEKADLDPKRFLLCSNVVQQAAFLAVCMTPLSPDYFLPIAGAANILFNVAFTGFGAINAKCIQQLSDGNLGEIYAKISIINTLGSSIGLLIGLGLTTVIVDNTVTFLCVMPIVGLLRIYTFNRAIKGLVF